jgi:hypothetical protein
MKRSIANAMLRPLSITFCLFASACGGGGDTSQAPNGTAQPLAGFAGYYATHSTDNTFGEVLIHPGGAAVGTISTTGVGGVTLVRDSFAGSFAASGAQVFANGALFVHESSATTETGKSDVTMLQGTSADQTTLTVAVTNTTVPDAFSAKTYTRAQVSVAFRNLPMQKLSGTYLGSGGPPPTFQNVSVNADTGVVNGVYASDGGTSQCQIAGTLSGYDPATTMFRLAATFTGPFCASLGVPAGNGDFVGVLESSRFGQLVLSARGIMNGKYVTVSLVHSQQLGTY